MLAEELCRLGRTLRKRRLPEDRRDLGVQAALPPRLIPVENRPNPVALIWIPKDVRPLEPCCFRFSAPLVEKVFQQRSKSSIFAVARTISLLLCWTCDRGRATPHDNALLRSACPSAPGRCRCPYCVAPRPRPRPGPPPPTLRRGEGVQLLSFRDSRRAREGADSRFDQVEPAQSTRGRRVIHGARLENEKLRLAGTFSMDRAGEPGDLRLAKEVSRSLGTTS